MACKIKKLLLKGIFTFFGVIFVMSQNIYATELNVPVRLYDTANYRYGSYLAGTTTTNVFGAFTDGTVSNQVRIYYTNMNVHDGLYLDAAFYVYNYAENNSVDGYMNPNMVSCNNGGIACQVAGVTFNGSGSGQIYHVMIYVSGNGTLTDIQLYTTISQTFALRLYDQERMQPLPLVAYSLLEPSSGGGGSSVNLDIINNNIQWINNNLNSIYDRLGVMNGNIPSADDVAGAINDSVESETEQASQEAQNQADSSQSNAEGATSSLISVIGGFVSTITNAQPSNCKINGNMGKFNMGMIDLCANPVPSYISIIGSIIVVMLVIPFCIIMFNRFIGLFRSFQD